MATQVLQPSKMDISEPEKPFVVRPEPAAFGAVTMKAFSQLHGMPNESDATILVGEERIPVNKFILAVWSAKFREMLKNPSNELQVQVKSKKDTEIFKMMLLYLYTGTLKIVSDDVLPLLQVAAEYGVHPLIEQCAELLGEDITEDTVFSLLLICDKYSCTLLRKKCAKYLASNFTSLVKKDRVFELDVDTCFELVKSDDIDSKSEEELFQWVVAYAKHQKGKTEKNLGEIVSSHSVCADEAFIFGGKSRR